MAESVRILIEESSQTADARRVARKMAKDIGFDPDWAERVAIVMTEACTNVLKHAGRGEVLLCKTAAPAGNGPGLELLVLDQGPGMSDIDQCLRDGYSTGSSQGQGLGAIRRLSTASDFYSIPARGTGVLARWSVPDRNDPARPSGARLQIGAVNVSKPGQAVCGDSWGVEHANDHTVVLMADGLGHGIEAQTAALEAVRMLHLDRDLRPVALIERVDRALRSSRGAAVAVARIDPAKLTVAFAGVGNISAHIYSGATARHHLVSMNGTAGYQSQRLQEFNYPWPDRGMLVLHSDGLSSTAGLEAHPRLALCDPTLIAGILYRDFKRGYDDSTVVVAKAA